MNIKILNDYSALSLAVARSVFEFIKMKLKKDKKCVLGLATGQTQIAFYKELLNLFKDNKAMDLQNFHTFNLDEYYPIEKSNKNSYFTEMSSLLFNPLKEINSSFNPNKNSYLLNGETNEPQKECLDYEEKIKKLKGIDLQMLGIGINGHLAFNEPGTVGNSRTRVVDLAEETIQVNADKFFDGNTDKVPKQALSMGIGTILEAKKIFLVASGKSKKNILTKLRNTKIPSIENPASYLLTHPDVTWWLDKDAY